MIEEKNSRKGERSMDELKWAEIAQTKKQNFPLEIFPDWIREMVLSMHEFNGAAVDYAAGLILAVAGTCVFDRFSISLNGIHTQPLITYSLLVGDSGSRKSSGFFLRDPVLKWTDEKNREIGRENKLMRDRIKIKEKQIDKAMKAGDEAETEKLLQEKQELEERIKSKFPTLISDTTLETLAREAARARNAACIFTDEASFLDVISGDLYGKDGKSNKNIVLQGYDRQRLNINRQTFSFDAEISVFICLAAQPSYLETVRSCGDQGFAQRVIFYAPDVDFSNYDPENSPNIPGKYISDWEKLTRQLLETGRKRDTMLSVDPEGMKLYKQFEKRTIEKSSLQDNDNFKGWLSKNHDRAARIAGILSLMEDPNSRTVTAETMRKAIYFCENYAASMAEYSLGVIGCNLPGYLLKIMRSAVKLRGEDKGTAIERTKLFDNCKKLSRYDLKKNGKAGRECFDNDLKELRRRNLIQEVSVKKEDTRGPGKSFLYIHPDFEG